MRRLLLLAFLLLPLISFGQSGQYSILRPRITTPATCATTEGAIYWDAVALELKVCTATNTWTGVSGGGSGTVTSVTETFVGGLISVAGSPITHSGTLALTVAGTSGGIPYFGSSSSWASSGVLAAGMPVLGGGAGTAPTTGTISGSTTTFATTSGTLINGDCVAIDASGNLVDAGVPGCGGGGGGGSVTSVALAAPTGFPITGSPIVGSGTLTWALPSGWTTGSLLLGDGANSAATLLIGSSGKVLTSNGTTASWQTSGSVGPGTIGKYAIFNSASTVGDSAFLSENGSQPATTANIQFPSLILDFTSSPVTVTGSAALNQVLTIGNTPSGAGVTLSNGVAGELLDLHACNNDQTYGTGFNQTFSNLSQVSGIFYGLNYCTHYPLWWNATNSKWELTAEPHMGLISGNVGGTASLTPAIQYVGATGSDTNDGITPATPVHSVLQALRNLSQATNPKGGTVYVANGSWWSSYTGEGLYLMGTADANYAACAISGFPCLVSGKHWMKWNSARIIGLGGTFETNSDQTATELLCGGGVGCNTFAGPTLAFSGVTTAYMENFKLTSVGTAGGPTFSWGIGSDGNRAAGGANSTFYNMQISSGNFTGRGPAVDIGGNTFELYFDHSVFTGNNAEVYPSNCTRVSNVVTCTLVSGSFSSAVTTSDEIWLWGFPDLTFGGRHIPSAVTANTLTFANQGANASSSGGSIMSKAYWGIRINPAAANSGSMIVTNSHFNTAGISYTSGSTNWDLYVENTYTENQPANTIGIAIDELSTPGNVNLINFRTADASANAIPCLDTKSSGGVTWSPSIVSDSNLNANSSCVTGGTILQSYPGGYSAAQQSWAANNTTGFLKNHVIAQTDASRRNFPPAIVKYPNVAAQLPAWGTSGSLSTVTAPDGIANAAGQVLAGGSQAIVTFGTITTTFAAGDYIVAGVWEAGVGSDTLSSAPARVRPSSGTCTLVLANGFPLATGTAVNQSPLFSGFTGGGGEWVWEAHLYKVYAGGSCTYIFEGLINAGKTQKFAYPVFFTVPAASATVSEIADYVLQMNTYPDTASVGDLTMERKQRFSMADPQSAFFAKMTSAASGLTADRIFGWPNIAGTVGVVTGSSPTNNDCAKFVVTGSIVSLTTAGAACGSGGGGGTVTSVDATVPSWLAVTGVPIVGTGTIAIAAATGQTAHKVIGTGSTASFAPVSLTTLDLPFTYSGNTAVLGTVTGSFTAGHTIVSDASGNLVDSGTTGGTGTVTSFSAGTLSPLFTTSVATATSTPALTFSLSTAAAHTTFMNNTGGTAAPGFQSIGVADLPFTYSGNTTKLATTTGALTNGNCVSIDASGNLVDSGGLCGGGGGGGSVTSVGFAASTGFTVSGSPIVGSGTLTLGMPTSWTTGDLLLGDGSNSVSRLAIGTNGFYLKSNGTTASWAAGGTVTSIAETFTGGLISVAGSPVTTTGTLALTVAGTSGGIPYFSGATTWASSAALTANLPVIGGGAGAAPTVGTVTGNTTKFATSTGSLVNGHCVTIDANGNLIDSGAACGGGGGGLPGGTDTAVQVNHPLNTFFGDATNFSYNTSTHKLTTTGDVSTANVDLLAGGVVSSADTGTPSITFSSSAVAISGTGSPADFVSIPVYTAGPPAIVSVEAAGSDADVSLNLVSKGTGQVLANGVPINTNTWLYVTNYGAVGNSSTGDDVTLQAAIDACPAAGCTLFFPAGTYYVAGTNATITNVAQSLFSATFTATNSFTVGDYVTVSGMSDGTLNGLWRITSRTGSQFVASGAISQTVVSGAMSGTATRGLMARTPFIEFKGVGFPGRDTGAPSMIKSTTGANPMYLLAIWPMASANGPKVSQLGFQDNTTSRILMGGLLIVNSNSLEVDNNLFFNFTCAGKTEGTDVGYGCGTGLTLSGGGDTGQTTGFTQWGTIYNNSMFLSKRGLATRANVASITFIGNNIQCYLTASPVTGSIGMDFGDTFGRNYSASALGVPSEMVINGTQIQNCDIGMAGYNMHHGIWAGKSELLGAVIGRASTIGARIDGTSTSLTGYADLNWASVGYDKGISVVANTRQLNIIKQSMTSNTLDLSVSDDAVSVPLTGFGYTANKVAQVAAITDTAMQASTTVDTAYRFNGVVNCTAASASATATLNLKYFDTSNTAQTVSATATCTTLGASSVGSINTFFRQINGHSITYGVTIANTPTYDVSVRLEQK